MAAEEEASLPPTVRRRPEKAPEVEVALLPAEGSAAAIGVLRPVAATAAAGAAIATGAGLRPEGGIDPAAILALVVTEWAEVDLPTVPHGTEMETGTEEETPGAAAAATLAATEVTRVPAIGREWAEVPAVAMQQCRRPLRRLRPAERPAAERTHRPCM